VSRYEIKRRTLNLLDSFQWHFLLKTEVVLPWPTGQLPFVVDPATGYTWTTNSSDPNRWWRDWLEANVGQQGWRWQWRTKITPVTEGRDHITIRFRNSKDATAFTLIYG
jgi:hypothetical protein